MIMTTVTTDSYLILTCALTERHFHGIRIGREGDEECDWPPSPGRVFQSLVNAAFAGLPAGLRNSMNLAVSALRWLEQMPAPDVMTHDAQRAHLKVRLNTALPLNNRTDSNLLKSGLQLAPLRRISGYDLNPENNELVIRYVWHLPEHQTPPLDELNELAARVSYFGRAEDRVEMSFALTNERPAIPAGQVQWNPSANAMSIKLAVPRAHSLRDLGVRHEMKVPARIRKPNSLSCLKIQAYERHDLCALASPGFVGIVSLSNGDGNGRVRSFDPRFACKYRAWLRGALIRIARDEIHWMDRAFALEMIAGHLPDGTPTKRPHLAIVPLPSLHHRGLADGQVRRIALLGFAPTDAENQAADVFRTLVRSINGNELIHDGKPTGLVIEVVKNDGLWQQFTGSSCVWATAFPIALKSKFDVSKALSGNERHLRKQQELQRLIRRALTIQGLSPTIAAQTAIVTSSTPFLEKTERVEKYLTENGGYFTHARLEFPSPMKGPLVIGDGRYSGMGLCFPLL